MKIIQIAATEINTESDIAGTLYALADDGSIWMRLNPWLKDAKWQQLPLPKQAPARL